MLARLRMFGDLNLCVYLCIYECVHECVYVCLCACVCFAVLVVVMEEEEEVVGKGDGSDGSDGSEGEKIKYPPKNVRAPASVPFHQSSSP